MAVLVLVEHAGGAADDVSQQAATLARGYAEAAGEPLEAVLFGPDAATAAQNLGTLGATAAYVVVHERLTAFAPHAWGRAIAELVETHSPSAVIAPGSERATEAMAHAAAFADLPLAANCTEAAPGDAAAVTRLRWGGSLFEEAAIHGAPKLLTVAPHAVGAAALNGAPAIEPFAPALEESDLLVRVVEHVEAVKTGISLAEAKVVVSGGRGVGSADGFGILEELAGLLDAAVGCSRVVTSAGWRPHTDQVGQTGTKVSPDLYIACGISGATQHIAGCKGAKKILAINSDAEAPILNSADYAVIGDLTEIVPAITAELRKSRPS
jgi:electron transfer flavoprotein alpha subunit